ncbi:hypothetical protein [Hymenobacter armeniacus]|uniref:Uncharacterized protein n=1 Tax=Hymenobacter armeniacus TaxID=2771358 RepID=A0ABR8JYU0_9BACT|nr:hypothetical protein [Hymenobacter armeniacus]MBD2724021.1 hypothetical protein [Hymenobacter armeniacus]
MKKLVGTLLVLALGPTGAALEGCADKYKCSVDTSLAYFDVDGLTFAVLQRGEAVAAGQSVAAAEISLAIQLQKRYYSQRQAAAWLPAAYACPPAPMPGYRGTTEVLDSLVVRCVYAYDAAHPAGTVVNDLLAGDDGKPLPLVPVPGTRPDYPQQLRLRQAPSQAGPQQFALRYRLTNGEIYTARTPLITLR